MAPSEKKLFQSATSCNIKFYLFFTGGAALCEMLFLCSVHFVIKEKHENIFILKLLTLQLHLITSMQHSFFRAALKV